MATASTFNRADAMKALGEFIRSRRRTLGLTQTQLGSRIGYYQERISCLECGSYGVPSLQSMHDLAFALEVPVEQLLTAAGSIAQDTVQTSGARPDTYPADLPQRQSQLRAEYEAMCRRFLETEELANEVLRLRAQLSQRRTQLQRLTASCMRMVR